MSFFNFFNKPENETPPVSYLSQEYYVIPSLGTTENGALCLTTTGSKTLDFFVSIVRGCPLEKYLSLFLEIFQQDSIVGQQILLNLRDIRTGKGEKLIPQVLLFTLKIKYPQVYKNLLVIYLNYACWKDIIVMCELSIYYDVDIDYELQLIVNQLQKDYKSTDSITLCAKWVPSEKSRYNKGPLFLAKKIANKWNVSLREYRKRITQLRKKMNLIEQNMSQQTFELINFSAISSIAHKNYSKALKKDKNAKGKECSKRKELMKRYLQYLKDLKDGNTTINSTGLQPHQLVEYCRKNDHDSTIELQWKDIVNKIIEKGTFKRSIAIVDTSGSMEGVPIIVSIALGILVSECSDTFKDVVIPFNESAELVNLKNCSTLHEKVKKISKMKWGYNTNIKSVFTMLLDHAETYNIPKEDMIDTLFIFTDMQFDEANCNNKLILDSMREKYEQKGYAFPKIVCWNLRSSSNAFPVDMEQEDVIMMSGFSSELLKDVLDNGIVNPVRFLSNVLCKYPLPEICKEICEEHELNKYLLSNSIKQLVKKSTGKNIYP